MLHDHMASGLQEGESQPEFRHPREDDKFIISPVVQVALPPLLDGTPGITAKMMWSVRSRDIAIKLLPQNLKYCFAALRQSKAVVKETDNQEDDNMSSVAGAEGGDGAAAKATGKTATKKESNSRYQSSVAKEKAEEDTESAQECGVRGGSWERSPRKLRYNMV